MDFQELATHPWIYGPLASLGTVLALMLLKRWVFRVVSRLASKTATEMDDLVLAAADHPLTLLIFSSGLLLLSRLLELPPEADRALFAVYTACIVTAMVWFVDRMSRGLLERLSRRIVFIAQARGVIQGAVRGIFIAIGILILLDSMGISITPLIASLGVGSLAVALALQDTLANLFAGMHLLADKAIEPGNFIRIESGQEGRVEKIGYRSTRVRMVTNVTLIVPNLKMVNSVITNYSQPDSQTGVAVPAQVGYQCDLEHVERVTLDVAKQVMRETEGGAPETEPQVRYQGFGESGIDFNVILQARSAPDLNQLRHVFIKRLHERYRAERIDIPYPVRRLELPPGLLERRSDGAGQDA